MKTLTARQQQVLAVIARSIAETGSPPSYRAIARELGLRHVKSVEVPIAALVTKGYLVKPGRQGVQVAEIRPG